MKRVRMAGKRVGKDWKVEEIMGREKDDDEIGAVLMGAKGINVFHGDFYSLRPSSIRLRLNLGKEVMFL